MGAPACAPWHSFPHARFTITRRDAAGALIPATKRLVNSDDHGRFNLSLAAGRYQLTPLPQAHTRGGNPTSVTIKPGRTTRTLVRFEGYPQML